MASAGSLEHVPGKGLLSLWPVPYAALSSASAAGHYHWLDFVVSAPFDLTKAKGCLQSPNYAGNKYHQKQMP